MKKKKKRAQETENVIFGEMAHENEILPRSPKLGEKDPRRSGGCRNLGFRAKEEEKGFASGRRISRLTQGEEALTVECPAHKKG